MLGAPASKASQDLTDSLDMDISLTTTLFTKYCNLYDTIVWANQAQDLLEYPPELKPIIDELLALWNLDLGIDVKEYLPPLPRECVMDLNYFM